MKMFNITFHNLFLRMKVKKCLKKSQYTSKASTADDWNSATLFRASLIFFNSS